MRRKNYDEERVYEFTDDSLGTADDVVDEIVNLFEQARSENREFIQSRVGSRFEARVRELQRRRTA
jgi:hypothetical protein